MSRVNHVIRRGAPVLALVFGVSLIIAGCGGGGGGSSSAGGLGGGGNSNASCAAIEKDYASFLVSKLPISPSSDGTNEWDALSYALGQAIGGEKMKFNHFATDVVALEGDATTISDDLSQSAAGPRDYQQFDTGLKTVAEDCGTTLKPLPKTLGG